MSNRFRLFMQYLALVAFAAILTPCQAESITPPDTSFASINAAPMTTTDETTPPVNSTYTTTPGSSTVVNSTYKTPPDTSAAVATPKYLINVRLLEELNRYQKIASAPWPLISGRLLHLGSQSDSVILLRQRLEQTGDLTVTGDPQDRLFDQDIETAVKTFQDRHGLESDGIVGSKTAAELNISPQDRIKQIEINMQRWANLSTQLGDRYIMVNIPEYQLHLFDNGREVLTMKAIVGKPTLQTPELSSRITRIVFNPFWNVPVKIAAKDVLPKAINDPYYLDDMHIKVFIRDSNHSEEVNNKEIDWQRVNSDDVPYDFRQEPGDDNALGLIKFEFPNRYDVYLHDTPVKTLFSEAIRALSHGCIRLEDPLALANYLMQDNPKWDPDHTQQVIDTHETSYVRVKHPIPIFITYLTVWVDDNGVVNYRNDVYNRDLNNEL